MYSNTRAQYCKISLLLNNMFLLIYLPTLSKLHRRFLYRNTACVLYCRSLTVFMQNKEVKKSQYHSRIIGKHHISGFQNKIYINTFLKSLILMKERKRSKRLMKLPLSFWFSSILFNFYMIMATSTWLIPLLCSFIQHRFKSIMPCKVCYHCQSEMCFMCIFSPSEHELHSDISRYVKKRHGHSKFMEIRPQPVWMVTLEKNSFSTSSELESLPRFLIRFCHRWI